MKLMWLVYSCEPSNVRAVNSHEIAALLPWTGKLEVVIFQFTEWKVRFGELGCTDVTLLTWSGPLMERLETKLGKDTFGGAAPLECNFSNLWKPILQKATFKNIFEPINKKRTGKQKENSNIDSSATSLLLDISFKYLNFFIWLVF